MKTIGVLGGVGPQATMDFEARIHRAAQRLIPQPANSVGPPLVVYYHNRAPVVTRDGRVPLLPLRPDPDFLEAARWLGTKADFLVIAANGPHRFQEQIEKAAEREVLSMIAVTLDEVQRRRWGKVGVLGLGEPTVYTRPLERLGIAFETIDGERRDRLNAAIFQLMEGREDEESATAAREAVATLRSRSVDGIILGCTEIPLLLGEDGVDLINPAELLAEAAVRRALG